MRNSRIAGVVCSHVVDRVALVSVWLAVAAMLVGCRFFAPAAAQPEGKAPIPRAEKIPKVLELHGERRVDDYYWLRERENPKVLAYLKEENAYTKAMMAHTE